MPKPERIPYCKQSLGEEEIEAVTKVLASGWITRGPLSRDFESRCAERMGASHAVSCTNGSVSMEIALRGLGIGPGDEVIVPTLTWIATASAVRLVGAQPIFCDVDPVTHCVTPETVAAAWTANTRAVIAVDMCGVPCDIAGLRKLVDSKDAFLIEDAAHSFGATHAGGEPVGADGLAHVASFSFHPAKTITTAEGGMVSCADTELAERMRRIRSSGMTREFEGSRGGWDFKVTEIGSNYHLSEVHACMGLVQLERMDGFIAERRRLAQVITSALAPVADLLLLPTHPAGSCWNLYVIELAGEHADSSQRDALVAKLNAENIAVHLHYPLLHNQPAYQTGSANGPFPNAERYERRALTLPLFPGLSADQITRVADALISALQPQSAPARS